jgi:hypothetical protein
VNIGVDVGVDGDGDGDGQRYNNGRRNNDG